MRDEVRPAGYWAPAQEILNVPGFMYRECAELLRDLSATAVRAEAAERERDAAVGLLETAYKNDHIHPCSGLFGQVRDYLKNPATAARTRRMAALDALVMLCYHDLLPHMERNDKFDGRGSWSPLTNKLRAALAKVRESEEPTK